MKVWDQAIFKDFDSEWPRKQHTPTTFKKGFGRSRTWTNFFSSFGSMTDITMVSPSCVSTDVVVFVQAS